MELIDKAAVVAEIDRIIEEPAPSHDSQCSWEDGYYCGLCKTESIIDTLEVKEVDLERELIKWHKEHFKKDGTFIGMSGFYLTNNSQMDIAQYFYELGLKTQKGE